MNTTPQFVSLSDITNLCEEAMTTGANVDDIAGTIATAEDKHLPRDLRGRDKESIAEHLHTWRAELVDRIRQRYLITGEVTVDTANEGGNAAVSDLILTDENGEVYHVETKFGNHTNAASGIARVNSALQGAECFTMTTEDKNRVIDTYLSSGEETARRLLWTRLIEEVEAFPSGVTGDGRVFHDMIRSSGATGNSDLIKHYSVIVLKSSKDVPVVEEVPLNLSPEDQWRVSAVLGPDKSTPRLTYHAHTVDGSKRIRMVYNNKNSLYVVRDDDGWHVDTAREKKDKTSDDLVRIPSRIQAGTGSYNIWYQEDPPVSPGS